MAGRGGIMMGGNRLAAVEKQRQALQARIEGATYAQIAEQVGYAGTSGAEKAVKSALRKTLQEPADELRTLHFWRLEAAWRHLMPELLKGNPIAITAGVRVLERQAKLFGLDAPVRLDVRALVRKAAERHGLSGDESRVLFDRIESFLAAEATA